MNGRSSMAEALIEKGEDYDAAILQMQNDYGKVTDQNRKHLETIASLKKENNMLRKNDQWNRAPYKPRSLHIQRMVVSECIFGLPKQEFNLTDDE